MTTAPKTEEKNPPKKASNTFPTFDELKHQWQTICTKKKTNRK